MQTNITARHFHIDEDMKVYMNEKLNKLSKYSPKIEDIRAVFVHEKLNYTCEVTLTGKKTRITASDRDEDLRASFDKTVSSAEKQLKRFRDKVKDRSPRGFFEGIKNLTSRKKKQEEGVPGIIKSDSFATKPMSPEEAVEGHREHLLS